MLPFQLRPITDADLDALVALDSDPEIMRFINGGQPTPRALCAEVLLPRMLEAATRPGLGFFAVESPEAAFMGWVHLRPDSFERAWAEIGYRLASRRVMEKVGLRETGRFVFPARTLPGLTSPQVPGVLYTLRRYAQGQEGE